jgi:transcriptional regulator GlxA family with amidase domain
LRIHIVVFNGFDELDAIGPFEVLRNAAARARNSSGEEIEVELASLEPAEYLAGAHGLRVQPQCRFNAPGAARPDLVIVPGGGWNNRAQQGAWAEAERGELPRVIAELHTAGTTVASVCTGAMLLAAAGLVKGRPATTHKRAVEQLRAAGAQIVDARVVDDGDLITAGGVTSGLDLALWLVERCFGAPMARAIENEMEYELRGPVWRRRETVRMRGAAASV